MKKKLVVLTGAGISAESGIKTFRDSDGLWEGHNVMDVATPEGWYKNPALVLDFYNQRRKQLKVARTGTLLQQHQPTDPFQIRKDLAIIDNKLKQVGKTAMLCSNTLPQHKPRKRPRPRRPRTSYSM